MSWREKTLDFQDLRRIIDDRNQLVYGRFRDLAFLNVNHPELLSMLKKVIGYWKDFLRPALTSFCCEAVGGNEEAAVEASVMFTMAAAGLSIHDDILDKSNKKHNRTTILGDYGLDKAVLVGDLLLLKAWTQIGNIVKQVDKSEQIMTVLNNYSVNLCEAQLIGLSFKQKFDVDVSEYKNYLFKLNADLEACTKIGAILGGGTKEDIIALEKYGKYIGFMLGLMDDLADTCKKESLFHRIKHESLPLTLIFTIRSKRDLEIKIRALNQKSIMSISEFEELQKLCKKTGFIYMQDIAKKTALNANNELSKIKDSNAKTILKYIIHLILGRITCPWP